jgi:hypothetical protein
MSRPPRPTWPETEWQQWNESLCMKFEISSAKDVRNAALVVQTCDDSLPLRCGRASKGSQISFSSKQRRLAAKSGCRGLPYLLLPTMRGQVDSNDVMPAESVPLSSPEHRTAAVDASCTGIPTTNNSLRKKSERYVNSGIRRIPLIRIKNNNEGTDLGQGFTAGAALPEVSATCD